MKNLVTILSSLAITSTVFAGDLLCFDATAIAAKAAVVQALGTDASKSKVNVYSVSEGSWSNGKNGPYKQQDYNTRSASGAAYIGGYRRGGEERRFEVSVDTKAGTCEVLGTKVKFTGGVVLE